MPWKSFLNTEALRHLTDGNRELEEQFVTMFMETATRCIRQLEALSSHDPHLQWSPVVHELKGAALNIHADAMVALCKDAEYLPVDPVRRQAVWQKMDAELQRYQQALTAAPK